MVHDAYTGRQDDLPELQCAQYALVCAVELA